ncbi:MAG: metalloregulator ArsR/SmtB family transcription factor [Candidatus Cohnella colombiensis]|uniref:Metalloregulator ArsR/SmtB family transcription factor n=1 Tax=Candidatus Cohnella colombiensis TaxID=3121368 RepID=A0AA95JD41_9BACL|nr:MAG: metalloregulator ArsR/SmtB family transcription factor [Cohnella sp.]
MNTATMSALAEPNRVNIVELLRDAGALTLGEIAQRLGLRLPQSSKHLRVLTDAGLVNVKADANRRIFSLCPDPFVELDSWLESFIKIKEEQYDRFDELLKKVQEKE